MECFVKEIMKILVWVAHYDDEILSCGGWILEHSNKYDIDVIATTFKGQVWKDKFFSVTQMLGVRRAISLDLPLWKSGKKLVKIKKLRILQALAKIKVDPNQYDMILTHGEDGDIDFHEQHQHIYRIASHFNVPRLHFVAFPRIGIGKDHRLYKWAKAREAWNQNLLKGILPRQLIKKADYIYQLKEETVIRKEKIFKKYLPMDTSYAAIHYPVELFYKKGEVF